jgi:hypothetical protein
LGGDNFRPAREETEDEEEEENTAEARGTGGIKKREKNDGSRELYLDA